MNALLIATLVLMLAVLLGQGVLLHQAKQHRGIHRGHRLLHQAHDERHDADDAAMRMVVEQVTEFQEFLLHHPEVHRVHLARHTVDDEFGTPLISVHKPTEWGG